MSGHKNAYDCIKAFSETDFTEDLKKFDVPTLIIHGDDDQIVPIGASAMLSVEAGQGRDAEDLSGRRPRPGRHAARTSSTPTCWRSFRRDRTGAPRRRRQAKPAQRALTAPSAPERGSQIPPPRPEQETHDARLSRPDPDGTDPHADQPDCARLRRHRARARPRDHARQCAGQDLRDHDHRHVPDRILHLPARRIR